MKLARQALSVLLLWAGACRAGELSAPSKVSSGDNGRYADGLIKWNPSVSTSMRYMVTGPASEFHWSANSRGTTGEVNISPDGTHFFFTTIHGDLKSDSNVMQLSVFAVADVVAALGSTGGAPSAITVISMCNKEPAIGNARWVRGGQAIEFLGREHPGSSLSAYRLDLRSRRLQQLISVPEGRTLRYLSVGGYYIYMLIQDEDVRRQVLSYPLYALNRERLANLVMDRPMTRKVGKIFVAAENMPPREVDADYWDRGVISPSPDANYAVVAVRPRTIPPEWSGYDGSKDAAEGDNLGQLLLLDLRNGTERPLFNAPTGRVTKIGRQFLSTAPFWSADGKSLIVQNTTVPISDNKDDEIQKRMSYLVSTDIQTGDWSILEPCEQADGRRIKSVQWLTKGYSLLVEHTLNGKPTNGIVYTYEKSRWAPHPVEATVHAKDDFDRLAEETKPVLPQGLSVRILQGADKPPMVVAAGHGREIQLMSNDPALDSVWIAPTKALQFEDRLGQQRECGIILPREMPTNGEKIPVVVQLGHYLPWSFRPDGMATTAYAAQSLAAQGMAVVTLDLSIVSLPSLSGSYAEMATTIDWIDAAVLAASKQYPIDLERVGIVGFSRAGIHTRFAITHFKTIRPAAAIIADSYTEAFGLMLAWYATRDPNDARSIERLYGGVPFWQAKSDWLEKELTFNVDKVQTPTLFADNTEHGLGLVMDTIGAFTATHRPFDYLIFPDGKHQLEAPAQRRASMALTVDWMAFWLLGKELDAPEKIEQFSRWREIKDHWTIQRSWETAGHPAGSTPNKDFNVSITK